MRCLELKLKGNWTTTAKKGLLLDGFNIKVTHPEGDSVTIGYGGFYIAEAPEYDAAQNLTSIIAYDEFYPSMQAYTTTLWQSGITVKNYLIAILNKLDINYDANSLNLMANADKVITSEKFLDVENDSTEAAYTYRDILDEIAKATGVTFAFRNSLSGDEYKLYAIKPTDSGYVIDESNLRSVTIGAKYGPVKGVVLSREPQEDNVYYPSTLSSSQTAVKIANIEIMEDESNDAYRETFIQGIYSNVLNTEYYLYDLESFGIGFLNFGDIFTIKASDRENGTIGTEKSYETIFMRTDMTIGSGIKEKSKLEAPQATSTDYAAASTTDKALKKTMLKVDKQEQRITALVKESDERYTELKLTAEGLDAEITDTKAGLEAKITATAEAATSQYTALKAEVKDNYVSNTTYNTYVKQTAETLQMQAESIEQITAAGYLSTDECKELISAEKGNITLAVERNLKIGARNILLDSACFASFTPSAGTATIQCGRLNDLKVPSGKVKRVVFNPTAAATAGFKFAAVDIIGDAVNNIKRLKPQTTYTLSWWMKYNDTGCTPGELSQNDLLIVGYGDQGSAVSYDASRTALPQITTSWQKYIATFMTPSEVLNCEMRLLFKNSTHDDNDVGYIIDISSLKLEEGNIATDWSPSAEDIDQSVKAQISMCVTKDENNNLTSEINISGNKIEINSDNFTLEKDGTMICRNATISSKGVDEDGEDNGFAMEITQANLKHTFAGTEIGYLGVSMDLSATYYETLYGGQNCGVSLQANDGDGYRLNIYDSGLTVLKSTELTAISLSESAFGVIKGDNTLILAQNDDYNIDYPYYTRPKMSVISTTDLLLAGNATNGDVYICGKHIVLDGEVIFNNYRGQGSDSAPLKVYRTSGEVKT